MALPPGPARAALGLLLAWGLGPDCARASREPTPEEITMQEPYSCDAITPGLCNLKVTSGSLLVRRLRLKYWIYGEAGGKTPLVMIHGGPAHGHDYMLPLKQQACRGRQVLFYDQVGSGASERPENPGSTASWLLSYLYYPEELTELLQHLGWQEYHILGHGWGAFVAQNFALAKDPGLKALVLASPYSDPTVFTEAQWDTMDGSVGTMPPFVQQRMKSLEGSEDLQSQEQLSAIHTALVSSFTVRTFPLPDCFLRSEVNPDIYVGMWGASEFGISGRLKDVNITNRLPEIQNPVLITSGRYDTMRPRCVETVLKALPKAEWRVMRHSGHMTMIDDPEAMNDAVAEFLEGQEEGAAQASSLAYLGPGAAWMAKPVARHRAAAQA